MTPITLLCICGALLFSCSNSKSKPAASTDEPHTSSPTVSLPPAEKQAPSSQDERVVSTDKELVLQFEVMMKQARANFDKVLSVAEEFDGDCSKAATSLASLGIDGRAIDKQGRVIGAALGERPQLRDRIQQIAMSAFPLELQETAGKTVAAMQTQCASDPQFQSALQKTGMKKAR